MDLSLRAMQDKDLIKQLKGLQQINPDTDRAFSVRESLVNHIDGSIAENSYNTNNAGSKNPFASFALHFSRVGIWATAGTFAILLGVATGVNMSQDSIPGSTLYPVKIVSEDVQGLIAKDKIAYNATRASERLEETSRLASTTLSEEDAEKISQELTTYKENIEEAKTSGDDEQVITATREAEESSQAITSLISNPTETTEFRIKVEERLTGCHEEKLLVEATELLDKGGLPALIDAHLISVKCEKTVSEPTDEPTNDLDSEPTETGGDEDLDQPVSSE